MIRDIASKLHQGVGFLSLYLKDRHRNVSMFKCSRPYKPRLYILPN
uniref:Uncharacterized protein n=1 Tax=Anguilla anguilla TaxID=7936 RepID=A0A0E9WCD4_ANGAN